MLNVYRFIHNSLIYGPYKRDVIWFKGCTLGCKNCINKHLWSTSPENMMTIDNIIEKLSSTHVTLLGGEPLQQIEILKLIKRLKENNVGIILFTGYEKEELNEQQLAAANLCDVVIYGRYDESLKDDSLYLRGSTNQKIIFNTDYYDKRLFDKSNSFEILVDDICESRGRSKNFIKELLDL